MHVYARGYGTTTTFTTTTSTTTAAATTTTTIVRKNMLHMAQQVEVEYRLFLMIDLSLYRSQPTFSGGCVKFYSLAFFKIQDGRHDS